MGREILEPFGWWGYRRLDCSKAHNQNRSAVERAARMRRDTHARFFTLAVKGCSAASGSNVSKEYPKPAWPIASSAVRVIQELRLICSQPSHHQTSTPPVSQSRYLPPFHLQRPAWQETLAAVVCRMKPQYNMTCAKRRTLCTTPNTTGAISK